VSVSRLTVLFPRWLVGWWSVSGGGGGGVVVMLIMLIICWSCQSGHSCLAGCLVRGWWFWVGEMNVVMIVGFGYQSTESD